MKVAKQKGRNVVGKHAEQDHGERAEDQDQALAAGDLLAVGLIARFVHVHEHRYAAIFRFPLPSAASRILSALV